MKDVLVDTAVWSQHFKHNSEDLQRLLLTNRVRMHPMILGEIACGTPPSRATTLSHFALLPTVATATNQEVMDFLDRHQLYSKGCGWVDFHLLVSVLISENTAFWTRDKRLRTLAKQFKVAFESSIH